MAIVLEYIWALPVAIGVVGVLYFALQDLAPRPHKIERNTGTGG